VNSFYEELFFESRPGLQLSWLGFSSVSTGSFGKIQG
jgi:hypothetical protein